MNNLFTYTMSSVIVRGLAYQIFQLIFIRSALIKGVFMRRFLMGHHEGLSASPTARYALKKTGQYLFVCPKSKCTTCKHPSAVDQTEAGKIKIALQSDKLFCLSQRGGPFLS